DPSLLQQLVDILGHPFGQVDRAVVAADVNRADIRPRDASFIGNRADNIGGAHSIDTADFDLIAFHTLARRSTGASPGATLASTVVAEVATISIATLAP